MFQDLAATEKISQSIASVDISELFNPERFTSKASPFKLIPGTAFDICTGWDLSTEAGRAACWTQLELEMPTVVIGSPPCGPFSAIQNLNPETPESRRKLRMAYNHLKFCVDVYKWQIERDAYFLHEHPFTAKSWRLQIVKELMKKDNVSLVVGDQCPFGQGFWQHDKWCIARKRTGWLTNMPELKTALACKCCNATLPVELRHEHHGLLGGVAWNCAVYPPSLVDCILQAIRRQLRLDRGVPLAAVEQDLVCGPHVDDDPLDVYKEPLVDPSTVAVGDIYDEYTGIKLDSQNVLKARLEEIGFFDQLKCWLVKPTADCMANTGRPPLPTRWIDHDKSAGDGDPELRSRFVVCETKKRSNIAADDIASVFSSTPPLEVFRLLCSLCMSLPAYEGESMVMIFLDISRAHPHCDVLRENLYVEAPAELGLPPGFCLLLLKCIYGLRDANQAFEFKVRDCFHHLNFVQGRHSSCVYVHQSLPMIFGVHGDDYVGVGPRSMLLRFADDLGKHLIVKNRGVLGPRPDDCKEMKLLARTIRWSDAHSGRAEQLTWEPDARHVDQLCEQLGILPTSNGKATTADKARFSKSPPLAGDELPLAQQSCFKSCCMRANFLALDRPDIAFMTKELARCMSKPTTSAFEHLKHLTRFLLKHKRLVWSFVRQSLPRTTDVLCDANWAGCIVTRKSTTCVMIMFGRHLVASASFTQAIISLSSGESEFYAMVKATCRGIGVKSLLADMNIGTDLRIFSDSSAALGISSRRGAAGVRHIATQTLWIQQLVANRKLKVVKKCGKQNGADIGTKVLDEQLLIRLLATVGLRYLA